MISRCKYFANEDCLLKVPVSFVVSKLIFPTRVGQEHETAERQVKAHLASAVRQDQSERIMFEPRTGLDVTKNWALAFSPGIVIVATWWPYLETLSIPVVASYCAVVPFGSRFLKFNISPEWKFLTVIPSRLEVIS